MGQKKQEWKETRKIRTSPDMQQQQNKTTFILNSFKLSANVAVAPNVNVIPESEH